MSGWSDHELTLRCRAAPAGKPPCLKRALGMYQLTAQGAVGRPVSACLRHLTLATEESLRMGWSIEIRRRSR